MRTLFLLAILVSFLLNGCSKPEEVVSKKALELIYNTQYKSDNKYTSLDNIKLLSSKLVHTDLDRKYYSCIGLIKLKCTAQYSLNIGDSEINPGETYYHLIYLKSDFTQGSTGALKIDSVANRTVTSKDGAEVPLD